MPSTSLEAMLHRARHQLHARDELVEKEDGTTLTNLCDWLHDTPVTNRKEKRRALGQAKHFGCYEEKVPDKERRTDTTWVHSRNCPKYDWKKAFDKKLAEQAAVSSAAEKAIGKMFEGVAPLNPDPAETRPIAFVSRDDFTAIDKAMQEAVDDAH